MNYYVEVLKKYAVFTGRARRAEYWYFALFNVLVATAVSLVGEFIAPDFLPLDAIYAVLIFLPSIGVSIRRLHDTGRSGWNLLWSLLPIIGAIVLLVFMVKDSDAGDNKYGPNPKKV